MKLSLTILAHGAAKETFMRHLPLWQALDPDYAVLMCPKNDSITFSSVDVGAKVFVGSATLVELAVGSAEHAGRDSILRLKKVLNHLADLDGITHHLICEYDSFSLASTIKPQTGFTGNLVANNEPCRFMTPRYANPPWLIDHMSLFQMQRAAEHYTDVWEEGYADRYLSAIAHLAGVPILPYDPPGYTQETIHERDWPSVIEAIHFGATMIHGVKDDETLELVTDIYNRRQQTQTAVTESTAP